MTSEIRAVVRGTGNYLPEKVLTNEDLEKLVDTSDEWITKRTGIKTRRIAADDETVSDMGTAAARVALENARLDPADLDLVICATFTGDRPLPATGCILQHKIGATRAAAFDLAAACSGFVYGMSCAWGFIRSGIYKTVLVVGAEKLTSFTDYTDRTSCILFGDGAGAAVLQADTSGTDRGILTCHLGSDGGGADLMTIYAGGSERVTSEETLKNREHYMVIQGREVFKFAANKMKEEVEISVKACGLTMDDVKLVVPHQVNTRILDFAAEKLNLPTEKMYTNIDRVANTSAASVPIALHEANAKGLLKPGDV
ncbi:MAG TPA: beta-ketoacyl-ACP synthase III, partial [Planctomycetota bacterium]|nr:beta-ketoacyl-ACP synthase III [Planctomycetota bacterium]